MTARPELDENAVTVQKVTAALLGEFEIGTRVKFVELTGRVVGTTSGTIVAKCDDLFQPWIVHWDNGHKRSDGRLWSYPAERLEIVG